LAVFILYVDFETPAVVRFIDGSAFPFEGFVGIDYLGGRIEEVFFQFVLEI
jgi:hypothetical protein